MGKTFQPVTETEFQRKMKKILEMKGRMITVRMLRPPESSVLLGRVGSEIEATVESCDEDCLILFIPGSGTNRSLPLEKIMISRDDERHRPALELKA
jgi:hypothetical protein